MKKDSRTAPVSSDIGYKCRKSLDKLITPKRILFFLLIMYIASLIPLFIIGCYNYPAADDYNFGAACRQVWVESHSIASVLVRAVTRAWEYYLNWAGCMTSSFLMALQPAVFGEGAYKITPFIMIGILSFGTFYLMRVIFIKLLKCDSYIIYCITVLMLFVMIQCMPDAVEGLFWYNGAVHYTFMHSISLFFYGVLISALIEHNQRKKCRGFILAAILAFIAAMGNYMTALNVGIVLAMLMLGLIIGKKFKEQRFIIIPAVVFYLSFIVNITAPGNAVRAAGSNGMNPLKAVFASFYYVLDYCLGDWSGWVVIIFSAIIAVLFWNSLPRVEFDFPFPLFIVFMNYCILSAMVTPPLYGTGNIEAGRIRSLFYIMYILLLTFTVCYVTGWARKKTEAKMSVESAETAKQSQLSFNSKIAVSGCILFLLAGSVLCLIPYHEYYTFSVALTDIVNGSAAAYGNAMQERIKIYNASVGSDVEVEPLPAMPELLCTADISQDSEDWLNQGLCRFYELKSVRVSE